MGPTDNSANVMYRRWLAELWNGNPGVGITPDGEHMRFFGNDILRARDGRFIAYWVASSAGGT